MGGPGGDSPMISLSGAVYMGREEVEQAVSELQQKSLSVLAGLEDFSAADKIAYYLLKKNGWFEYGSETDAG